jgi:WD40 repeat protein
MSTPPVVPDHTLLRPIGHGAYGEVWLARNVMGTYRAVKVIYRTDKGDRAYEREFAGIQRYEPVSRSSGGLVHVLQVGRNDPAGYFYYVMELADPAEVNDPPADSLADPGQLSGDQYKPRTLRFDLKARGRLPTTDCLRLALDVVTGLAQLHRRGLVHRDVKPGNIIYASGRAKLADIGLVSAYGEGRTFVGTEGYIPPEGPGTVPADLFALGVVLYEASTGYSPERFPDVPNEWLTTPAGDEALEFHEIILKACEGEAARRYQTAEQMHADLALLQSGRSVRQMRAMERRIARLKITGALGTTLLLLALGIAWFASYRAQVEAENRANEIRLRNEAQRSLARAEAAEHRARDELSSALYEQARALVLSREIGHRARALEAIHAALAGMEGNDPASKSRTSKPSEPGAHDVGSRESDSGATNRAELRRIAFAALGLPDLRLAREIPLATEQTLAQVDPAFERVALGRGAEPVTICSLSNLQVQCTLYASSRLEAFVAQWSADGRHLAVKRHHPGEGAQSELEVWEPGVAPRLVMMLNNLAYGSFSFHPFCPVLLTAQTNGSIVVWDLEDGTGSHLCRTGTTVRSVAYSPDGQKFAACYRRGNAWVVAIHSAETGHELAAVECPEPSEQIAWDPHGRWVAIVGDLSTEWNRAVRLIAADTGQMTVLGNHKIKTAVVQFTPQGEYLFSTGWDRELICWDLQTRERVFSLPGAGYSLTWRRDGKECALIFPDRPQERLQFYAFDPPACHQMPVPGEAGVGPGAFSPDDRWLAVPIGREICLWDLEGSSTPARLPVGPRPELFFSPQGSVLYALTGPMESAQLRAWRLSAASEGFSPPQCEPMKLPLPLGLSGAAISSNALVLTGTEGVWFLPNPDDPQGPARVVEIPSGKGVVSHNSRWLAVTYPYSPEVTVYRLSDLTKVATLTASGLVARVSFTSADDELAIISRSGLEWWDTASWQRSRQEPGSPVAEAYLLDTADGVGIWKVTSFQEKGLDDRRTLRHILPLPRRVVPLALSSDGRQLAVSADDQRLQLWNVADLRARLRELGLDWNE